MKRNRNERLIILQNIILKEPEDTLIMEEDDILDTLDEYLPKLPKDAQRVFQLYYIDMVSHKDIGIRFGCTGSTIAGKLRSTKEKLREMCHP